MWSQDKMEQRLVRYQELIPCTTAFIDTRTPGKQKENFTIIGPGVAENPDQHVHIDITHGFNVGGVRQEPHCVNSQHSHETAEVFIVQNSEWAFRCGVEGEEKKAGSTNKQKRRETASPGDCNFHSYQSVSACPKI